VIDGDTIDVQGTRIRLFGIDPPEMHQQCRRGAGSISALYPCGRNAKAALERIIGGSSVSWDTRDHDRYGPTVAGLRGAGGGHRTRDGARGMGCRLHPLQPHLGRRRGHRPSRQSSALGR
jgi:endonuclease YncB( thermonuclease family)